MTEVSFWGIFDSLRCYAKCSSCSLYRMKVNGKLNNTVKQSKSNFQAQICCMVSDHKQKSTKVIWSIFTILLWRFCDYRKDQFVDFPKYPKMTLG